MHLTWRSGSGWRDLPRQQSIHQLLIAEAKGSCPQRSAKIRHCVNESLNILVIVIEVERGADISASVRGDDASFHKFFGQKTSIDRRNGHRWTAPIVSPWRDAGPAYRDQTVHASPCK